jgi:hypothetical protein
MPVVKVSRSAVISIFGALELRSGAFRLTLTSEYYYAIAILALNRKLAHTGVECAYRPNWSSSVFANRIITERR